MSFIRTLAAVVTSAVLACTQAQGQHRFDIEGGDYRKAAVKAVSTPGREATWDLILKLAPSVLEQDDADPEPFYIYCGTGYDSEAEPTIAFLAGKRPEVVRAMLADPGVKFKSILLPALLQHGFPRDEAIALRLAHSSCPAIRAGAVRALSTRTSLAARGTILRAASDPTARVRFAAAEFGMDRLPPDEAIEKLLRLVDDPNSLIRTRAAYGLRRVTSPRVAQTYLRQLRSEPTRAYLAFVELAEGPSQPVTSDLIRLWEQTGNRFALWLLAMRPDVVAIETVREATFNADAAIRADGIVALRWSRQPIEARVLEALEDPNSDVIDAALFVVRERSLRVAIPILEELLRSPSPKRTEIESLLRYLLQTGRGGG